MAFLRKILDMLNMDNLGRENEIEDDTEEVADETMPSDETTPTDEDVEITEKEVLENLEKQYYIVEEKPQKETDETAVSAEVASSMNGSRSGSARGMGNRSDGQTDVLYHDRFDEEYRKVDNYREITFNGRNFGIPEVQLCAAILLSGNQNGSQIRNDNEYSLYFEGRYGIVNISKLHQWLYEQGYFRKANFNEAINLYKVPELKMILESLGLKKTGNKPDLIDRVINAIDEEQKARIVSQCERLFVTEKGCAFLRENEDYVMWHRKSYGVTFEEFNQHRILCGRKRRFHDTIFQALSEKAYTYQYKQWFSKLGMIYFNLSEVLYDEGRYDLALQNTLFRLYFSTNLASHTYYFDIDYVKFNGIKNIKEHIMACNDVFYESDLKKIVKLRDYYGEHILDVIYGYNILPYCIFDKKDMANVVHDLLNEVYFDVKRYMDYICMRYEKYIKKFL